MVFEKLEVMEIKYYKDNLFLVKYLGNKPIITDDIGILETASNTDEFRQPFMKFIRTIKVSNMDDSYNSVYNDNDVIFEKPCDLNDDILDQIINCY